MLSLPFLLIVVFAEIINGDASLGGPIVLKRFEIEEINGIADDNIREELSKSMPDADDEYVEPTPPPFPEFTTPSAASEIETIRRNLTDIESDVECNITARYLWDLCRPVLLRTCKAEHQIRCRTNRGRDHRFNRRLERMFPRFRPPRNHFFNIKPILQWFDDQISTLNDSDTGFQFSITITNNNGTRTFTNEDAVKGLSNINREVQRALEDVRSSYGNLFHNFPNHREREPFGNWMSRILRYYGRGEGGQEESHSGEEEGSISTPMKTIIRDPSVSVPKRLQKLRRHRVGSRTKRHNYRQRSGHRRDGNRRSFMGRPQRFGSRFAPSYTQRGGRPIKSHQIRMPAFRVQDSSPHHRYHSYLPSWMAQPPPEVRFSDPSGRDDDNDHHRQRFPDFFRRGGDGSHRPRFPFFGRDDGDESYDPWRPHMFGRGDDDDEYGHRRQGFPDFIRRGGDNDHHRPRFPHFFGRDDDDDEDEDNREEDFCRELEDNPEICLEIADRTEKCENELEGVCPKYVEARRMIRDQLGNVFRRQHLFSETAVEGDGRESEERYRWEIENEDEPSIVIDSISISRQGKGDAYVRARLFNKVDMDLRVPASEFDSDVERLGKAIGKLVVEKYRGSN